MTSRTGKSTLLLRKRGFLLCVFASAASVLLLLSTCEADWPTYQHDNARSGITTENVKLPLHEQWTFISHTPQKAWPTPAKELPRVQFDDAYQVAVAGDAVFFGSSADHKVYSLDAASGGIRWATFTEGPVRLAPTVWRDRVLVGSDDGNAYCLSAGDGRVLWSFRAGFHDRRVLGNGSMISLWPLRTGVCVDEGIAYFGAGIFPAEDVFLCAVRVEDGELVWRNDTSGEHGPEQEFGGVSPQGYLLVSNSKVYVPSGRAMPAAFDKSDGRFLYHCSPGGKVGGTWALLTNGDLVAGLDWKVSYDTETGRSLGTDRYAWFPGLRLVAAPNFSYMLDLNDLSAVDRQRYPSVMSERKAVMDNRSRLSSRVQDLRKKRANATPEDRKEIDAQIQELSGQMASLDGKRRELEASLLKWRRPCRDSSSMILAGDVLFVGGKNEVIALDALTGGTLWKGTVGGQACGLAVSGGRLFVSTDRGGIHCFGETERSRPRIRRPAVVAEPYPKDELSALYASAADDIVKTTGVKKGFCFVLGCEEGRLAFELARRTELRIVGIEPDPQKVDLARRRLDAAGLYGSRITVDQGSLTELPYSDYFANLIVSDTALISGELQGSSAEVSRVLRPCGGIAYFGRPEEVAESVSAFDALALQDWLKGGLLPESEISAVGGRAFKITRGALPAAGEWTHLYADSANTAFSRDRLVKCPLGVLWFGRPGPERMVDRHARAAGPLSLDGRLFVQGENVIMAYDAYNGTLLWEKEIPGAVRVRVDADGGNLAASARGLFVAAGDECFHLDPATGETIRKYKVPPSPDGIPRRWGYVAAAGDLLYGSSAPPLGEYGALWEAMVGPDGNWATLPEDTPSQMKSAFENFTRGRPSPDANAYADFQYSGGMWQSTGRFPKWGDVRTSVGAVTSGIMASDSIFSFDTKTNEMKWIYRGDKLGHPTISMGDGILFFAESSISDEEKEAALADKRRRLATLQDEETAKVKQELEAADVRRIVALDAATGDKRWEKTLDLTGCGGDRMGTAYHGGNLYLFGFFSNHDRGLFRSGTLKWRRIVALSAEDGDVKWSEELGYLRRPVVMEDKLIVEPWLCDAESGKRETRFHPITGEEVPWEFIRGGHSCGITIASPHCFFLRSYSIAYYDMDQDRGMLPFGGVRLGCWLNTIVANGLVLLPEASSGCRCSFPVRSTIVMAPRQPTDENRRWSLFPTRGAMTPGDDALTPVKRLAINFGAPGDRKDEQGTLWFGYPRPRLKNIQVDWVLKLALNESILPGMGYFDENFRGARWNGAKHPWIFASGCRGLTKCEVPLIGDGDSPASYTVRMYFVPPEGDKPGQRDFDIKLQGNVVHEGFDIARSAGSSMKSVVREFKGVSVSDKLLVEFVPSVESPGSDRAPLINGIEIIREES